MAKLSSRTERNVFIVVNIQYINYLENVRGPRRRITNGNAALGDHLGWSG